MTYIKQPWIVLFGGGGREGVVERMVAEGIEIRLILVPFKQTAKMKDSVAILARLSLRILEIKRDELSDALNNHNDCNLLTVGYPYIIPKSVYSKHKLAINIHPTRLPNYRGPTTGAYILINNEKESGSTVHLLEEEADKGCIIAQSRVSLGPFDTIRSLQRKVYELEPPLIIEAFRNLELGKILKSHDKETSPSYPERRKPIDSEIDPSKPLIELIDKIRASDSEEFPAFFYHHGQKVCIRLWRELKPPDEFDLL